MDESSHGVGGDGFSWVRTKDRFFALPAYKQLLIALVILMGVALVLALAQTTLRSAVGGLSGASDSAINSYPAWSGSYNMASDASAPAYAGKSQEMSRASYGVTTPDMPYPMQSGGTGVYQEGEYDAIAYNAVIKKGNISPVCDTIASWKAQRDIVFESTSRDERTCTYQFKVTHALHQSTLEKIERFSPDSVTATIVTTKKQMVRYNGELAILIHKQNMLEATLRDATLAFEELMTSARSTGNVDALSKTIDKKLTHLKQLSDERIALAGQIQRIERNMAELQDRVDFVHFSVRVEKYGIIDATSIRDSWVYAMKQFVADLNRTLQGMTLGLLLGLLSIAHVLVYLVLLLVLVKYGWRAVREFWKK